jgi:hypothetical protein
MVRPRVVIDINDANCARDLAAGGMFVGSDAIASAGCALTFNDEIDLVVRGGTDELMLHARVVFVDPTKGAGLELVGFDPAMKEQIAQLEAATRPAASQPALELLELAPEIDTEPVPLVDPESVSAADSGSESGSESGSDSHSASDAVAASDADAPDGETAEEGETRKKLALTMHERLRGLTIVEQIKKANSPDPAERMTLERIYGKTVWEHLLRNPRLTAPEVARLARLGTLPRTLIELIVANGAWIQIPEVRRALLGNPRLGVDQILRVLRLLPKHELKVAASLMTYPFAVRDAAKRLLKGADS